VKEPTRIQRIELFAPNVITAFLQQSFYRRSIKLNVRVVLRLTEERVFCSLAHVESVTLRTWIKVRAVFQI